ncbi:hypothetical protein GH714_015924 [Hevea brasiliensis]|uniref:Plastid division protein CDP1-like 2nd alpha solenoid domain-containing protein n=1 Tax=Hevea brasiliensis TaxID=3981 RepID=A0A6A6NHM1_HEVBR|nr:hypothetical protein GH714_015924 [Hevea brasiliensis]
MGRSPLQRLSNFERHRRHLLRPSPFSLLFHCYPRSFFPAHLAPPERHVPIPLHFYQVDLFVATPNNIPAERFEVYGVALALVAQAVTGKKPHLIPDADGQVQRLQQMKVSSQGSVVSIYSPEQNHEIDFALERGLCLLLVGELDECHKWLGLDSDDSDDSSYRNPPIVDIVMEKSQGDDDNDVRGLCKLLEAWLTEVVFTRFRDIKDIQFKLRDYYDDPAILRYLGRQEGGGHSSMAAAAAIVRIGAEATAVIDHAKASAIQALQKGEAPLEQLDPDDPAIEAETSGKNSYDEVPEEDLIIERIKHASVKIMCAGVAIGLMTLAGLKYLPARNGPFI